MTGDLKERLRGLDTIGGIGPMAAARITDLEARLAAAEAGEDALAECLRRLLKGDSYLAHSEAALAAYEARRKGK